MHACEIVSQIENKMLKTAILHQAKVFTFEESVFYYTILTIYVRVSKDYDEY